MSLYEDLEIEISPCLCGEWEIRVLSSPIDRPRERFEKPFKGKEFRALVARFEELLLETEDPEAPGQREALAREFGARLYEALSPGSVGKTLHTCLRDTDDGKGGNLRIRLSFGSPESYRPEIVGLPWELLRDPETDDWLSQGARTQVVRYLDTSRRTTPLRIVRPLRVLVVMASPVDPEEYLPSIDAELAQHRRDLEETLAEHPDKVEVEFVTDGKVSSMRKRLAAHQFHVLHFLGHGDFDEETGEGFLYFEEEDSRSPKEISGDRLDEILEGVKDREGNRREPIRLAVLNACQCAMMPRKKGQNCLAGVSQALVSSGFVATVAMQFTVSAQAAHAFSAEFYLALAENQPLEAAMAEGRLAVGLLPGENDYEWATPVLTMRTRDGRIFEVEEDPARSPLRMGLLSISDYGKEEIENEPGYFLDLSDAFDKDVKHVPIEGREAWSEVVVPRLQRRLRAYASKRQPVVLNMALHASLAFATGYFLATKSGTRVSVVQRGRSGSPTFDPSDAIPSGAGEWIETLDEIDPKTADLAVAVAVTWPVEAGLRNYLGLGEDPPGKGAPRIGRILSMVLPEDPKSKDPKPGQKSVRGGGHAEKVATDLANRIQELRSQRRGGALHLFVAAPNALLVFLGRLSHVFKPIHLYEYDESQSTYVPSFTLPLKEKKR